MQEADSEHRTACKSCTPNVNVELVHGSYWILSSMIALFEKNKLERGGKKNKLQYF